MSFADYKGGMNSFAVTANSRLTKRPLTRQSAAP